jgi:hypothetical protein
MKMFIPLIILSLIISLSAFSEPPKGNAPEQLEVQIINSTSVKFSWRGNIQDQMYSLRYRIKGDAQWMVYSVEAPTTVRRVFDLTPLVWYEWQVQSMFGNNKRDTTHYVSGINFVTGIDCQTPAYYYTKIVDVNKVIFRWEAIDPEAEYTFRVKEKSAERWSNYVTSANNLVLMSLIEGKTYEWDVTAHCNRKLGLNSKPIPITSFTMMKPETAPKWESAQGSGESITGATQEVIDFVVFHENEHTSRNTAYAYLVNIVGERVMTLPFYYKNDSGEIAFELSNEINPGFYTVEFPGSKDKISKPIIIAIR